MISSLHHLLSSLPSSSHQSIEMNTVRGRWPMRLSTWWSFFLESWPFSDRITIFFLVITIIPFIPPFYREFETNFHYDREMRNHSSKSPIVLVDRFHN
jgi:hypothetical protein